MLTARSQRKLSSLVNNLKFLKLQISLWSLFREEIARLNWPLQAKKWIEKQLPALSPCSNHGAKLLSTSCTSFWILNSESPNRCVRGGYLPISLWCSKQQSFSGPLRWFSPFLSSFKPTHTRCRASSPISSEKKVRKQSGSWELL